MSVEGLFGDLQKVAAAKLAPFRKWQPWCFFIQIFACH
jgi:hypothetical protein